MSALEPIPSSPQAPVDPLFIECIETLVPLAGERIQVANLDWWDVDRFLGLAFHIFLTERELSTRQQVAQILPKFGAKAVPTLFIICQHQNSSSILRELANRSLEQMDRTVLAIGLIGVLQSSEDDQFDLAISQMLVKIAPEAITALTDLIASDEWRTLALQALHNMQLPQTRALLNQLVCSPDPDIRKSTIDILNTSKPQHVLSRLESAFSKSSAVHLTTDQIIKTPILNQSTHPKEAPNIEGLMRLAAVQTERQDYMGAIYSYSQVISHYPVHGNAYGNRGLLKLNIGDRQGAVLDFQKAADIFRKTGKTANFEMTLNYLRKIDPQNIDRMACSPSL